MEFIFYISTINFWIKFIFIIFLFFFNIYLFLTYNIENNNKIKVLQSGFGGDKRVRLALMTIAACGANLSAIITIKNENRVEKQKLLKTISSEQDKMEYEIMKQKKEELINMEKTKSFANDKLSTLEEKSLSIFRKENIRLEKYHAELNIKTEKGNTSYTQTNNVNPLPDPSNPSKGNSYDCEASEDIKNSTVLPFDSSASIEWFEGLTGIKKLAVGIILGKSIILSALISIIFIFYGNILIEKYDLVNKYPKLARIIEWRRKYQKYYLNFNCLLIFIIVINELLIGIILLFI